MTTKNNFRFTVGICSYKRSGTLGQTLHDLEEQSYDDFEVVVVEQLPGGMLSTVNEDDFELALKKIEVREWANLPRARNLVLDVARGEVIIFIDDDVRLPSDFLTSYVKAYENHPKCWSIVGPFLLPGSTCQLPQRDVPGDDSGFEELSAPSFIKREGVVRANEVWLPGITASTWVLRGRGCNMSFQKSYLMKYGLRFCAAYRGRARGEETDLFLRVWLNGGSVWYDMGCALEHLGEESGGCRATGEISFKLLIDECHNRILGLAGSSDGLIALRQLKSLVAVSVRGRSDRRRRFFQKSGWLVIWIFAILRYPFLGGRKG